MATKIKPARTEKEWWAILKSKDKTFIRSMADWKKAIADPKKNPLKGCDEKTIVNFTKSLKFEKGGLGHAEYGEIATRLSFAQFKALWERFGLGLELFADHEGYSCNGNGDCIKNTNHICTSNC